MFESQSSWDIDKSAESLNTSLFHQVKKKRKKTNGTTDQAKNNETRLLLDSDDEIFSKKGRKKIKSKKKKQVNIENVSQKKNFLRKSSLDLMAGETPKTKVSNREKSLTKQNVVDKSSKRKRKVNDDVYDLSEKKTKKIKSADRSSDQEKKRAKRKRENAAGDSPKRKKKKRADESISKIESPDVETTGEVTKRKRKRKKKNDPLKNKYRHLALNPQPIFKNNSSITQELNEYPSSKSSKNFIGASDLKVNSNSKEVRVSKKLLNKKIFKENKSNATKFQEESPQNSFLTSPVKQQKANVKEKQKKVDNKNVRVAFESRGKDDNSVVNDDAKTKLTIAKVKKSERNKKKRLKKETAKESKPDTSNNNVDSKHFSINSAVKKKKKGHLEGKPEKVDGESSGVIFENLRKGDNSAIDVSMETESEGAKIKKKKKKKKKNTPQNLSGHSERIESADKTISGETDKKNISRKSLNLSLENQHEIEDNRSKAASTWKTGNVLMKTAREKLNAARFRFVNEQLYTCTGQEALKLFKEDRQAFNVYHEGFESQAAKWPVNPLEIITRQIAQKSKDLVVADFGCGDAKLSANLPQKVHSFDLVALNERVTVCDMSRTPLHNGSVDIAVFCLSLMGTNIKDYLHEANRVLKDGGLLKIAEVTSRFRGVSSFLEAVSSHGFAFLNKRDVSTMFYLFDFKKTKTAKKAPSKDISLKPCVYKRR